MTAQLRHTELLAWMMTHPELWETAPSDREDVTPEGRVALIRLADALEAEGFYVLRPTHHAPRADRLWALRVLVGRAKRGKVA